MTSSRARFLDRLRAFASATEPAEPARRFLMAFLLILCAYDACDLYWGGTAANYWLVSDAESTLARLRLLQLALLSSQGSALLMAASGRWLRSPVSRGLLALAVLSAFALRSIEAWAFFGLNDFYCFSLTTLFLAHFLVFGQADRVPSWPRRALRWQTAWIYLATAVLKLNPHWLSGEHMWVRQRYLAEALRWASPAWLARLDVNQGLAIAGVVGELSLAALLAAGVPRRFPVALGVAMHGFAAVALNVWFFGAAMLAQIYFVCDDTRRRKDLLNNVL